MAIQSYINPVTHDQYSVDQSAFISDCLQKLPNQFIRPVENKFNYILKKSGIKSANLELLRISERIKDADINIAMDDDEICQRAKLYSRECGLYIARGGIVHGRMYAQSKNIKLPEAESEIGDIARLSDEQFWRRRLRVKHGRAIEKEAININIVNAKAEIYASNCSVSRRKAQKTRNRRMLEEVYAVNEAGQEYTLAELADLSVSNPAIRRGELMTRIAGFEQYARVNNHVGEFYTITCPSRMHAMTYRKNQGHKAQVSINKKYDGTSPMKAQKYMSEVWARVRAAYKRDGIDVYGLRVAEPQHDGTPHWHMLLFMSKEVVESARSIYKKYSMAEDGGEPGAQKYRFNAKAIDWSKGTAAGYIAKYISKNIDAYGVDDDLYGKDANKSIERVDSWASTWGIRQFQQIGGHSVTAWRELRRLSETEVKGTDLYKHWRAADRGDWFAYITQCDRVPIDLVKKWNDKPGRYLEPVGWQIFGISVSGIEFTTKKHIWTIARKSAGAVDLSGCFLPPWSSVNNCTQDKEKKSEYEQYCNNLIIKKVGEGGKINKKMFVT